MVKLILKKLIFQNYMKIMTFSFQWNYFNYVISLLRLKYKKKINNFRVILSRFTLYPSIY